MASITISLPRQMKSKLDIISRKENMDKGDIILEALRKYIFRKDLDEVRERMIPRAQKLGIYTDEDVFKIIS